MKSKNNAGEFKEDGDQTESPHSCCHNIARYCHWSMLAISIILTIIFAYSAIVQYNDSDSVFVYATFYTLHFAFSFFVSLQHMLSCLNCDTRDESGNFARVKLVFWVVASVMAIWSVVMIIIPAAKLPVEGGEEDKGGDNNDATLEEEIHYEIAGASLGLFSALYHVIWIQMCDRS